MVVDPLVNVAVLCSGRGTNLQALLDAQRAGTLGRARIVLVVSNVPGAPALFRAQAAGVETAVVDHRAFSDRCDFERALLATLADHHIQIVALAGFMRLLSAVFLQNYPDRVINIHPSLLPAFPGMHAIKQALAYGVRISGCTVHLVDEGTDTGPVLLQAAVPVEPDDDEDRLAGRILAAEHRLFPAALRILAQGPLRREGRRVVTVPGD